MQQKLLKWSGYFSWGTSVKIQLDRMLTHPCKLIELYKKDYKFLKSYFLTGKDHTERNPSEAPICLEGYDTQYQATLLSQFWLSPDHSQECLDFLKKQFMEGRRDKATKDYNTSYLTYKESIDHYLCGELDSYDDFKYKNDKYKWAGETTDYNGPLFGDLELDMPTLFECPQEIEEELDKSVKNGGDTMARQLYERIFAQLLGYEDWACFNPNNPVIHWIDEYIRWGLPCKRKRWPGHKREFYWFISTIWYVIDTPEGRYPQQLDLVQELKQKILDAKKQASQRTIKLIDKGIRRYEKGKHKKGLIKVKKWTLREPSEFVKKYL